MALGMGELGAEPGIDDLEREHLARDAGADFVGKLALTVYPQHRNT